ncbi:MAG: crotonase/enoyl-CoA hydratase family protein [Deltaproteobacteria bacterium]|jgi:enoyl-CoA hydratase/carnithine racemase|nr:crotonase/enoyl-CoA hydratase family protein [Deltaproteobacteria bacterium]
MTYQQILYEIKDNILTLTLNRPDQLNAFTSQMREELIDAFDRADADDQVRAIIVTGAGRAFCAGADLSAGVETFDYQARDGQSLAKQHRDGGGRLTLRIFESIKPVIAAINGPAVGIGVTMTLAMDIRIAAQNAKFGFVFTRRGIVPEACSSWFLPRIVGISQALEWILSGRIFPADEAVRSGLVKSSHPPDCLVSVARDLAKDIAENTSAVSVALARQMLWRTLGAAHPMEAHKVESPAIYHAGRSADAREGITAFLEKRPAKFTDKPSKDMPPFYPWWEEITFI